MHTLLDLRGNIPAFIHVSDGKLHDVNVLDMMIPEPAAIYVMDHRVGGGIAPAVLPHHRAYGSVPRRFMLND